MEIKQSRSTKLANDLLNSLNNSSREFSTVTASMTKENSYYECGYDLYEKSNQRRIQFYGHMNYDKFKISFNSLKYAEVDKLDDAREMIISFLFMDENNELLNKVLKSH